MVLLTEKVLELEFVIPSPKIEGVFSLVEKRVDLLFDVQLTRSLQDSENAWLKLEGNGVGDINLAKEYIIAACCPEEHVNLILAPDSRTQLLGDSDRGCLVDEIEKRSGAYLSVKEGGKIEIQGASLAVAVALSVLEASKLVFKDYASVEVENALQEEPSVIRNDFNFNPSGEIVTSSLNLAPERTTILEGRTLSGGGNSTVPLAQGIECENTDQEKECAETADSTTMTLQKCEAVVGSGKGVENRNEKNQSMKGSAGQEIVKKSEVRDRDAVENENPADESLRDYALKLGYSEANITLGLSKLGLSADKNSLVAELLKAESSVKQLEEGSSSFPLEKYVPQMDDPSCLRPIVIDGSNVAMSHGNQKVFSCRGIGITVDWFLKRNHHDIKVIVPSWRKESAKPDSPIINQEVLTRLEEDELLVWTPSRKINGRRVTCYDDRYIVKLAAQKDGIIVSNDTFRDLQNESHEWKKVIELRLLMYTFVDDKFMPPDDPLGRHGPTLDEFLKRGYGKLCPYGRKCTFGRRCKYLHPERSPKAEGDLSTQTTEPREGHYGEISRPERPLPPCPPEAMRSFHKPLPPTPADIPSHILAKPLPLPPWEFAANMSELFPPTLRTNQPVAVGQRRPTSDPLPVQKGLSSEVQMMDEAFQRTHSVPALEDQACGGALPDLMRRMPRRGSLPQACPPPPYPSDIMARGRMAMQQMPHDGGPVSGEWILQEQMFGRSYQFPAHYPQTPVSQASGYDGHQPHSIPSSPWGLHPFPHPPHHYPPHPQACQYGPGNGPFYPPRYGRTPYRGQHNGYFKSRAPPVMDSAGFDVTDNAIDGNDNCSSHEEQRILSYEKLCELFPDDGEKILKVMDKYSEVTSVETLTQHLLEDSDI